MEIQNTVFFFNFSFFLGSYISTVTRWVKKEEVKTREAGTGNKSRLCDEPAWLAEEESRSRRVLGISPGSALGTKASGYCPLLGEGDAAGPARPGAGTFLTYETTLALFQ